MKLVKRSMITGLIMITLILIQSLTFASDFTTIYSELKTGYPQIIANLKSEGATDSDIQSFLNDLATETGGTSGLNESNFDSAMYSALKNVLFVNGEVGVAKQEYFNLSMAILNKYASTYSSGTLSGDMLSLRNVVMNAILGTSSGSGTGGVGGGVAPVVPAETIVDAIGAIVSSDSLGDFIEFEPVAALAHLQASTQSKVTLTMSEVDISTMKRINLSNVSEAFDDFSFVKIELPSLSLQLEKEGASAIASKTMDVTFDGDAFIFDWEETSPVVKDLSKPIQVKLDYKSEGDGSNIAVMRLLEDGTYVSEGGYYDGESVYFFMDKPGTYVIQENIKTFDDFSISDYWAANKVNRLASMGVIGGRSETVYDPAAPISRAEFATLITKMLKYDNLSPNTGFADVPETKWYANSVKLAQSYGLMSGVGDNNFNPDGNITQQEILIVLSKVLAARDVLEGTEESASNMAFKTSSLSTWASGYVENAISNGALNGMPISVIDMQKPASRLETANMLYEIQNELYEN